jgi:hypothetical protein
VATREDLVIEQGRTFHTVVRWEVEPLVYRPITAIAQSAPARLTVPAHGVVDGWRVAVVDAKGMTELNARKNPPALSDFHRVNAVDSNTLDLRSVSSASFKPYRSGGYIAYYTPADLTSYTARMTIKNKIGGTVYTQLSTTGGTIVLDPTLRTITLSLTAETTAALTFTKGVYDLEMVSPTDVVTAILYGSVSLTKEVTT